MAYGGIFVAPISYNSQCISFPEWIALFTLCLAPLIAHIASGTPTVSYLTARRPRWYDRLCHYNPTSIIWRYAAITDRRLRATHWGRLDLAASNAIFWTAKGWDGGEAMVHVSAPFCLRYPETTHVELMSLTMLKTIITTLQGVSALYTIIGAVSGAALPGIAGGFGVDTLFFPLAILGLLRLFAATWLTEDFVYGSRTRTYGDGMSNILLQSEFTPARTITDPDVSETSYSRYNNLDSFLFTPSQHSDFVPPGKSWKSRFFRLVFILVLGGVWAIAVLSVNPLGSPGGVRFTTTSFMLGLFYLIFTTMSFILYAYYFARCQTTTTVLPCLATTWYKVYTLLIMGLMVALIIVASIETNKSDTGTYTSGPPYMDLGCPDTWTWWYLYGTGYRGLASASKLSEKWMKGNWTDVPVQAMQTNNADDEQTFWLYNYTGYCMGHFNDMHNASLP